MYDLARITRALEAAGLPTGGPTEARVDRLVAHLHHVYQWRPMSTCATCGRMTPRDLGEGCAYCVGGPVPTALDALAVPDVETLDATVTRVRAALGRAKADLWSVALDLLQAREDGLWRARRTPLGQPTYANWRSWVREEIGISPSLAERLLSVAERYTEEEFDKYGIERLSVCLNLPAPAQAPFLQAAMELPRQAPRVVAAAVLDGTVSQITRLEPAGVPVGLHVVPLFKRAHGPGDRPVRATALREDPWGRLQLDGRTAIEFNIRRDEEGHLIASVRIDHRSLRKRDLHGGGLEHRKE